MCFMFNITTTSITVSHIRHFLFLFFGITSFLGSATIITDTPAGLYAIAFCIPENRQIESIQVERIIQPKKMKIEKNEAVEAEIVAEPKKDVIPKKRKRK